MSLSQIINFDSVDGIPTLDKDLGNIYHCYNTVIPIYNPIRHVSQISLKSLEMPILFNNIRAANGSNKIIFKFTYSTFTNITVTVTMPEGNYININTILSALNSAIVTATTGYAGLSLVFLLYPLTNLITISTNATALTLTPTILLTNVLGFKSTDVYASFAVNASNAYNLNYDNYILMHFLNIPISGENANGRNSSFKIPINGTTGSIIYIGENTTYKQKQSINDTYLVIDKIAVVISDRFGFRINGMGGDYSFTLEFTYKLDLPEVVIKYKDVNMDEC
jgi:hypothetical protein